MITATQNRANRGIGSFLTWAFILVVAYIVSIGPAARIDAKLRNPQLTTVLRFVYAPVLYLLADTPFTPVLEWYLNKWIKLTPPK
ncbi:MAG TPA: hypothetical protein VN887_13780 [Candidatus Angelobacter sp.]|nr:hypothetical protein [Candidatus Angelobacter sp.]